MPMNQAKGTDSSRKVYIDFMRIFAILFVVFNHTNTVGFVHFVRHEPGSFLFWANMFLSVFCKFGASLFFMISGAMLLNKSQLSIQTTLKKRVIRFICILLFFSIFYALSNYILNDQKYTLETFFTALYTANIKYHLWFLYAYIAFLLLLPILQCWCQHMEEKHFIYIIILHVIINTINIGQFFLFRGKMTISSHIIPSLPMNIITLPIIGYFLEHRIRIDYLSKKSIGSMWLISFLCITMCCLATYIKGMESGQFSEKTSQSFFSTFSFVNCITLYLTIKYIFSKIHLKKLTEKNNTLFG